MILIITISILLLGACKHKPDRKPLPSNTHALVEVKYNFDNPPVFKKEGTLQFVNALSDSVITSIDIEIADNNNDRIMGLMYRPSMDFFNGMLFLFDEEIIQSFWMRNTVISLDLIFVNTKREIVTIHKSVPTLTDSSFLSSDPAIFVVEVNGGFCDSFNIENGDKIIF